MNDLFAEITSFGKNCFQVQIGRGDLALHQVAFVNVSLLGGDNEHLNYVCGTASTCNGRNCRRCMSNRTYRFMVDADECKPRVDNEHEVLSFRRKTLKTKQLLKVACFGWKLCEVFKREGFTSPGQKPQHYQAWSKCLVFQILVC